MTKVDGCQNCERQGHKAVDCRSKKKTTCPSKPASMETVGGIYECQVLQTRECCLLLGLPDVKLHAKFQFLDLALNHDDPKMLNVPQVPVTIDRWETCCC